MRTKGDIRRRLWIYKFRPGRTELAAGLLAATISGIVGTGEAIRPAAS
jgi:hypothetical protein